jgi:hypothetical protein
MTIRCNAGVTRTNMIGRMDGYPGEIWFNPTGIANILSLSNVTKHFSVSYNSEDDKGFVIHKPVGDRRFKQSKRGLFYFDASEHMKRNGTALVNSGMEMERHDDALHVRETGVRAGKAGVCRNDDTVEPMPPTNDGVENVVGMTCEELVRMNEGGVTLINTVEENKTLYTANEQARALLARRIQNMIGHPSTKDFKKIVSSGRMLPNCPITTRDIAAAEDIFGPSLACLKGKTVRRSSPAVVHFEAEPVPPAILERHRDVTLAIDIMFVNKIPFLVTISRYLKFGTVEALKEQTASQIMRCIKTVRGVYNKRGFRIRTILADGEFEALRGSLLEDEHGRIQLDTKDLKGDGADLNVAGNDEHVPEVERYIRTVKDRTRSTRSTLPFRKIPAVMIIEMVYAAVFWLNTFPPNDGVSDMSPRELITGHKLDYNKHCKLELGAYVQTHETHDNTMTDRTIGAISLRPTGNQQGGYYFMSLASGRRLNRKPKDWTELPMPQEVLDRVHTLARRSQGALTFAWRDGSPIPNDEEDDDMDDEDYVPEDDVSDDEHNYDEPDEHPGDGGGVSVAHTDTGAAAGPEPEDAAPGIGGDPTLAFGAGENTANADTGEAETQEGAGAAADETVREEDDPTEVITGEVTEVVTVEDEDEDNDDVSVAEEDDGDDTDAVMDEKYGPRGRDGLRPRRERAYNHLNQSARGPHEQGQIHAQLEHTAFTQYSVKKGLKVFGQAGVDAVVSEMRQLDERKVIEPKNAALLTRGEKRDSLQYLMFLKKKRCGRIKGRGCADGRKQRAWKTKEESSAVY